ncbi:MAG: hypothetical protein KatS3mg084_0178 [Candidatus Dojkabacteria bacterium]|nr:MAG: hypothetical protein KatS3mg084_0178 [Candidatus Dojkabacteria bacterium]
MSQDDSINQPQQATNHSGKTGVDFGLLEKVRKTPAIVYVFLVVVVVIVLIVACVAAVAVVWYSAELSKKIGTQENAYGVSSGSDKQNAQYDVPAPEKRFSKTVNSDARSNEYKLGEELVISYPFKGLKHGNYPDCPFNVVKMPAEPVVNADGTKMYFVEESNPREVKVMDVNKKVSVVYAAPDNYPFVASMALGPNGSLSYTLLEKSPIDCNNPSDTVAVRQMHIVNGKELPVSDVSSSFIYEIKYIFNDEYFLTRIKSNGIGFDGHPYIQIIRVSDNSLVGAFNGIVYEDKLSGDVYLNGDGTGPDTKGSKVYKLNIKTGKFEVIFGTDNTSIQEITVTDDAIVVKYLEHSETGDLIDDELKTFEYKLNRN